MSTSTATTSTRRLVVALATAWGPKHGGINSFNQDLCVGLAEVLEDHSIRCIVLDADDATVADAQAQGVEVRPLKRPNDTDLGPALAEQLTTLLGPAFCSSVDWWIGHDVKTGPIALALSEAHRHSRACVIHHMSFDDYSHAKNTHEKASAAVADQEALLAKPDIAFAVGPLLFERLTELRGTKTSVRLIPGLTEPLARVRGGRISGAVFGRFEEKENLIKQAPLAVAAFSRAVEEGRDKNVEYLADGILRVFGIGDDAKAAQAMREIAEKHGASANTLQPHPYIADRAALRNELERVNLAMMLSLHEGFGLSGWEAVGMEIPLVVSKQSGLYRLLREVGGAATGCVMGVDVRGSTGDTAFRDTDVEAVKREIVNFALTPTSRRADAKTLRRLLVDTKKYTWNNCAATLAVALGLRVRADVGSLDEATSSERVDVLGMQNILAMARHRYDGGDYTSTLSLLARLPSREVPTELLLQADLLRAETYMRLNRYPEAQGLVSKLRPSLKKNAGWIQVLQCLGIENTIARDKGAYSMAVAIGREAVATAETHCPAMTGGARRKLARSLALDGDWQGALAEAEKSLTEAQGQGHASPVDEAKALLAVGEANRHGYRQDEAIKAYSQSREIALKAGHADCLLWASLGLADSRFLLGEIDTAAEILATLQTFLLSRQELYPLESLHCDLSLAAINLFRLTARARASGSAVDEQTRREVETVAENLIGRYETLGIPWPRKYLLQQVLQGDFSFPKRF